MNGTGANVMFIMRIERETMPRRPIVPEPFAGFCMVRPDHLAFMPPGYFRSSSRLYAGQRIRRTLDATLINASPFSRRSCELLILPNLSLSSSRRIQVDASRQNRSERLRLLLIQDILFRRPVARAVTLIKPIFNRSWKDRGGLCLRIFHARVASRC